MKITYIYTYRISWAISFIYFKAEGISYNLSNYMTMALDPNAANHVQYIKKYDPNFQTMLDSLSDELNRKLEESGLTIVELFKKIAIR